METSRFRSAFWFWSAVAVVLPPLVMYGYVAYDQWSSPGQAGWAAWRALPYGVVIGTVASFMIPLERRWVRFTVAFGYAVVLVGVLWAWGFALVCLHGDCI